MRVLLVLALGLLATPALAADYTDHKGTWRFTDATGRVASPAIESILLKLNDGTGWTAFVEPRASLGLGWQRPPTMAFECYADEEDPAELIVRGEETPVTGACTIAVDQVRGAQKYVVRFYDDTGLLNGLGVYDLRPIGS